MFDSVIAARSEIELRIQPYGAVRLAVCGASRASTVVTLLHSMDGTFVHPRGGAAAPEERLLPAAEQSAPLSFAYLKAMLFVVVPGLVSYGLAEAIHHIRTEEARDASRIKMGLLTDNDMQWLHWSALIIAWLTRYLNTFPAVLKGQAMEKFDGGAKGNIRANMYLYKVSGQEDTPVVLEDEGAAGRYNRANRSLHHHIENLPGLILMLPLAGYVYPETTFTLTCLFAIGRIWHQLGYASRSRFT